MKIDFLNPLLGYIHNFTKKINYFLSTPSNRIPQKPFIFNTYMVSFEYRTGFWFPEGQLWRRCRQLAYCATENHRTVDIGSISLCLQEMGWREHHRIQYSPRRVEPTLPLYHHPSSDDKGETEYFIQPGLLYTQEYGWASDSTAWRTGYSQQAIRTWTWRQGARYWCQASHQGWIPATRLRWRKQSRN